MLFNLLVALVLVYVVMCAMFESLIYPAAILTTFVFSIFGVFWLFWITGTTFSIMALIGVLILMGVVVNNGIVMIVHINQLRHQGLLRREALIQGAKDRLRPILMTMGTAILGMVPLCISNASIGGDGPPYYPMARAIAGGLVFSTLVSVLVLPTIYSLLDDASLWAKRIVRDRSRRAVGRRRQPLRQIVQTRRGRPRSKRVVQYRAKTDRSARTIRASATRPVRSPHLIACRRASGRQTPHLHIHAALTIRRRRIDAGEKFQTHRAYLQRAHPHRGTCGIRGVQTVEPRLQRRVRNPRARAPISDHSSANASRVTLPCSANAKKSILLQRQRETVQPLFARRFGQSSATSHRVLRENVVPVRDRRDRSIATVLRHRATRYAAHRLRHPLPTASQVLR